MFAYESSAVFNSLKISRETIPGNMTSFQYLGALDELISKALAPILESSTFAHAFVASLFGWQEQNFRRKLAFGNRREALSKALEFLVAPQEERVEAFRKIMLERGVRVELVKAFLASTETAHKAAHFDISIREEGEDQPHFEERCRFLLQSARDSVECPNLIQVRRQAEYWLEQAMGFREMILQKYYRLCLVTAQRDYSQHFSCSVPLDDVIGTYLLATMRAIDKCDIRRGVLTSHIQNWFLTARESVGKSRSSNSVALSDTMPLEGPEFSTPPHEDKLLESEAASIMVATAALVDPTGAARTFLKLSEPERQL